MTRFLLNRFNMPAPVALVILVFALGILMSVTGCETFRANVGPQVAKAVTRYCQEPLAERQVIRTEVNGLIAPNTIRVTCVGDPPSETNTHGIDALPPPEVHP